MRKRILSVIISIACVLVLASHVQAGGTPVDAQGHFWWHHAVVYEIYPRSFADSNNDGIGDLNGITARLDYLKSLGVDAIWLTPCYPSPQVDFGYDISDYQAINPEYGTLEDFDRLVAEAKKRGIRIIMDLVLNHTSDKHLWFVDSRSSRSARHREWYIWRDVKDSQPPNNWQSVFGGSAWKSDPQTSQYYYHFFYTEQPDLNWRNPEVKKGMFDVVRFWLDRSVAGFRLDAIGTMFEDPALPDNPALPGLNWVGDPNQEYKYNTGLPEIHDVLRDLRKVIDSYDDRVLIGETSGKDVPDLSRFYGKDLDEIQLPMNFFFTNINRLSPVEFRKQIAAWDKNPPGGWPVYLLSNHDLDRHYVRYGDGKNNDAIAKLTATLLLTLRGTPQLYYGEEIGMENNDPKTKEEVKDPIGKLFWPKYKGRDGERTPMQWEDKPNAGFSKAAPWLPVAPSYPRHNVAAQDKDPHSILNFYRKLIALRRRSPSLQDGEYVALNEDDPSVLSYLRKGSSETVLVVLNMSARPHKVDFDLSRYGLSAKKGKTLLSSSLNRKKSGKLVGFELSPFEAYVGRLSK